MLPFSLMCTLHFAYPFTCGWTLGGFCLWDSVNNVLLNKVCVYTYPFDSLLPGLLGVRLRSGIASS